MALSNIDVHRAFQITHIRIDEIVIFTHFAQLHLQIVTTWRVYLCLQVHTNSNSYTFSNHALIHTNIHQIIHSLYTYKLHTYANLLQIYALNMGRIHIETKIYIQSPYIYKRTHIFCPCIQHNAHSQEHSHKLKRRYHQKHNYVPIDPLDSHKTFTNNTTQFCFSLACIDYRE